jgi:hypothetical protein
VEPVDLPERSEPYAPRGDWAFPNLAQPTMAAFSTGSGLAPSPSR